MDLQTERDFERFRFVVVYDLGSIGKGIVLRAAGLFSGIGGFEKALSAAGFVATLLADIDPAARAVLRARFPDATLCRDVKEVKSLPDDIDLLVAGFPCQNLSMAGDKTGISGIKSGVVQHLFRLIEAHRVPTIVIENVQFMLHLDRGQAMGWLIKQFEGLGYRWAYRVLDTIGFGLPQRRRRVYLVASRTLMPSEVLFGSEDQTLAPPDQPCMCKPIGFYWTEGRSGVGLTNDGVPPIKAGSGIGIASPPAVLFPSGEVLTPSIEACEALQGFPSGWTIASDSGERNARWRLVGNAVSVPVASWVVNNILHPRSMPPFETVQLMDDKWPNAAYGEKGKRTKVLASERPANVQAASITQFRDANWKPLSGRALRGFIARAEQGGLSFPKGFLDALREACAAAG